MHMRAVILMLVVTLVAGTLAGCGGRAEPPPYPSVRAMRVDYATIEVRVSDLTPSTQVGDIRLVAPDGRTFEPESRRTVRGIAATSERPAVGVGATGGSESGVDPSISLSLPLTNWSWFRTEERDIRAVVARIPVPGDYSDADEGWHVQAELIDAAGVGRTRHTPVR
ncbi:hypothetical protein [Ferruginivarius sediminum]|nr:hypothetical protein [Ferruginivarius sediminum]